MNVPSVSIPLFGSCRLRFQGLDAHADTPVEILHVILLGHLKYFWKDVITRQLKDNRKRKDELAARICAVNVSGLGLSQLPGETMVKHAGSLVGRDFRALAQIAPFVLKGLVSDQCYEAWNCLSRLVPLVWQPEILNVNEHIVSLVPGILIHLEIELTFWYHRPCSRVKSNNICFVLRPGTLDGFINPSSTFFCICRSTYDDSDRPCSSPPRPSSPTTPSFAQRVFIQTDKLHRAILLVRLRRATEYAIFSAGA